MSKILALLFLENKMIDTHTEEMTEMMLKEFDKVYDRFDAIDRRFEAIDFRFNRIDYHISILDENVRSVARYMNLIGKKLGIDDELVFKTA